MKNSAFFILLLNVIFSGNSIFAENPAVAPTTTIQARDPYFTRLWRGLTCALHNKECAIEDELAVYQATFTINTCAAMILGGIAIYLAIQLDKSEKEINRLQQQPSHPIHRPINPRPRRSLQGDA
jgi:hypothetical protein